MVFGIVLFSCRIWPSSKSLWRLSEQARSNAQALRERNCLGLFVIFSPIWVPVPMWCWAIGPVGCWLLLVLVGLCLCLCCSFSMQKPRRDTGKVWFCCFCLLKGRLPFKVFLADSQHELIAFFPLGHFVARPCPGFASALPGSRLGLVCILRSRRAQNSDLHRVMLELDGRLWRCLRCFCSCVDEKPLSGMPTRLLGLLFVPEGRCSALDCDSNLFRRS